MVQICCTAGSHSLFDSIWCAMPTWIFLERHRQSSNKLDRRIAIALTLLPPGPPLCTEARRTRRLKRHHDPLHPLRRLRSPTPCFKTLLCGGGGISSSPNYYGKSLKLWIVMLSVASQASGLFPLWPQKVGARSFSNRQRLNAESVSWKFLQKTEQPAQCEPQNQLMN